MANLLYITCNLAPVERSLSLALGSQFVNEYLRWNPRGRVDVLDLYRDNIQRIDADVMSAWEKLERGEGFPLLDAEERRKVERIRRLAEQFAACDKYVFVTCSRNLFFPAEFKRYVDAVCVVDKTYRLTESGGEGMLHGCRKKSLHIHAAAPHRFGTESDLSVPFLRSVLNFLGVSQQATLLLEEGDIPPLMPGSDFEAKRRRLLALAQLF